MRPRHALTVLLIATVLAGCTQLGADAGEAPENASNPVWRVQNATSDDKGLTMVIDANSGRLLRVDPGMRIVLRGGGGNA